LLINYRQTRNNNRDDSAYDDFVNRYYQYSITLILLSLSKLLNSFQSHRSKLSPSSRIVFDKAWNPLFDNINDTDNTIQLKSELLLNELTVVNQLANKQFQEYENAPTHVLGATLMKQFLTDLLGRDTLYAKVFQNIIEKEMEMATTKVVSIYLKVICVIFVSAINFYFLYASILYGKDKSLKWQALWLSTFIINFSFDVFVNGTLEVYVLDFLVPLTISVRTTALKEKFDKVIKNVTSNMNNEDFNVSEYFFVSSTIARKRPDIPESKLILAYKSSLPDDISTNVNKIIQGNDKFKYDKGLESAQMTVALFMRSIISYIGIVLSHLLIQLGTNYL